MEYHSLNKCCYQATSLSCQIISQCLQTSNRLFIISYTQYILEQSGWDDYTTQRRYNQYHRRQHIPRRCSDVVYKRSDDRYYLRSHSVLAYQKDEFLLHYSLRFSMVHRSAFRLGIFVPTNFRFVILFLGAFYSIKQIDFTTLFQKLYFVPILYATIILLDLLTEGKSYNWYIHSAGIILGMISAISITVTLLERGKIKINSFLVNASFFLFCTTCTIYERARKSNIHPYTYRLSLLFNVPLFLCSYCYHFYLLRTVQSIKKTLPEMHCSFNRRKIKKDRQFRLALSMKLSVVLT